MANAEYVAKFMLTLLWLLPASLTDRRHSSPLVMFTLLFQAYPIILTPTSIERPFKGLRMKSQWKICEDHEIAVEENATKRINLQLSIESVFFHKFIEAFFAK